MKLARLESTRLPSLHELHGPLRQPADLQIAPVDAAEGAAPDRQRSLQQEVAEIEAEALADFHGEALIMADAKALAEQLAHSETPLADLIRTESLRKQPHGVDEEA